MNNQELRENTWLIDRFFPMNVFTNAPSGRNVLGLHWHEGIEILSVLQGRAVFTLQGHGHEAGPGDILIVNSGLLHSGYASGEEPVVYQAIVFHKALLGSATPDPYHAQYVLPFLQGKRLFPEKTSPGDAGYGELKAALDLLLDEFARKREGYELAVKAALQMLVLAVHRNCRQENQAAADIGWLPANIDSVKRLLEHIDRHYAERLTVSQAARMVALSPGHFCKTFKKLTGRTLVEFVNLTRVEKAAAMLLHTDLPVAEIAARTGFCNINYFDKIFRATCNCSPSQYRKGDARLSGRTVQASYSGHQGIPFELKLPRKTPLAVGSLTEEQFYSEIKKGMDDGEAGRITTAKEIAEMMRRDYGV